MKRNRMIRDGAAVIIALLLMPAVNAENIIEFHFWMDKDKNIRIEDVRVVPGETDMVQEHEYPLRIEVSGGKDTYSTFFVVPFSRLTNPPTPAKEVLVSKKLPYPGNSGKVMVFEYDNLLYSFDLSRLCVRDKECGDYENYLSCPEDCNLGVPDYLCWPAEDLVCDPDCAEEADPDCLRPEQETEVIKETEQTIQLINIIIWGAAAVVLVLAILASIHLRKKKR
ncbi:hypothetical protein GF351_00800 [Candidatus Woesearchaeota archaeon]|nr:hypothetical protein [Candidatus Woesearchaeota archaeon]